MNITPACCYKKKKLQRNLSWQISYMFFWWKLVGLIFLRFLEWKWKIYIHVDQSRLTFSSYGFAAQFCGHGYTMRACASTWDCLHAIVFRASRDTIVSSLKVNILSYKTRTNWWLTFGQYCIQCLRSARQAFFHLTLYNSERLFFHKMIWLQWPLD